MATSIPRKTAIVIISVVTVLALGAAGIATLFILQSRSNVSPEASKAAEQTTTAIPTTTIASNNLCTGTDFYSAFWLNEADGFYKNPAQLEKNVFPISNSANTPPSNIPERLVWYTQNTSANKAILEPAVTVNGSRTASRLSLTGTPLKVSGKIFSSVGSLATGSVRYAYDKFNPNKVDWTDVTKDLISLTPDDYQIRDLNASQGSLYFEVTCGSTTKYMIVRWTTNTVATTTVATSTVQPTAIQTTATTTKPVAKAQVLSGVTGQTVKPDVVTDVKGKSVTKTNSQLNVSINSVTTTTTTVATSTTPILGVTTLSVTVNTDSSGNWTYTVPEGFDPGEYEITVKDQNGTVLEVTRFTVSSKTLPSTGVLDEFILPMMIFGVVASVGVFLTFVRVKEQRRLQ